MLKKREKKYMEEKKRQLQINVSNELKNKNNNTIIERNLGNYLEIERNEKKSIKKNLEKYFKSALI